MLSGFVISPTRPEIAFLSSQFLIQTVLTASKRAILKYTNRMYRWKKRSLIKPIHLNSNFKNVKNKMRQKKKKKGHGGNSRCKSW